MTGQGSEASGIPSDDLAKASRAGFFCGTRAAATV
jgi:hypothetical protein